MLANRAALLTQAGHLSLCSAWRAAADCITAISTAPVLDPLGDGGSSSRASFATGAIVRLCWPPGRSLERYGSPVIARQARLVRRALDCALGGVKAGSQVRPIFVNLERV